MTGANRPGWNSVGMRTWMMAVNPQSILRRSLHEKARAKSHSMPVLNFGGRDLPGGGRSFKAPPFL